MLCNYRLVDTVIARLLKRLLKRGGAVFEVNEVRSMN